MSGRTGTDTKTAKVYPLKVTTTAKRLTDVSFGVCRITINAEETHRTDRRCWIGHNEELGSGLGFELNLLLPHILYADPSMFYIVGDNDFTAYIQLDRM
jgi:hypothetical protein